MVSERSSTVKNRVHYKQKTVIINYDGGFYIYDSIPPKNIEIIEENL